MNILKDDYRPGQPASAIEAGWLNAVARFINKLTGANGIRVNRTGEFPTISIDPTVGGMGTPTDNTSICPSDAEAPTELPDFANWTAGGEMGLKLRVYGIMTGEQYDHYIHPLDIEISASGMVRKVTMVEDKSVWIGA